MNYEPKKKIEGQVGEDSPEMIKMCLNCKLPKCVNCFSDREKRNDMKRKERA